MESLPQVTEERLNLVVGIIKKKQIGFQSPVNSLLFWTLSNYVNVELNERVRQIIQSFYSNKKGTYIMNIID
jgi:hypothetical protein